MAKITTLPEYLATVPDGQAVKMVDLIAWCQTTFGLELRIAWNQPMLTTHGTFIIAFTAAKDHMSIAVEDNILQRFLSEIEARGYTHTKKLFQFAWAKPFDRALLTEMIEASIEDKRNITTFWRKDEK